MPLGQDARLSGSPEGRRYGRGGRLACRIGSASRRPVPLQTTTKCHAFLKAWANAARAGRRLCGSPEGRRYALRLEKFKLTHAQVAASETVALRECPLNPKKAHPPRCFPWA